MIRKQRTQAAILLLGAAFLLNLIVLVGAESAPAWPIAAMILLPAFGLTLFSERRD